MFLLTDANILTITLKRAKFEKKYDNLCIMEQLLHISLLYKQYKILTILKQKIMIKINLNSKKDSVYSNNFESRMYKVKDNMWIVDGVVGYFLADDNEKQINDYKIIRDRYNDNPEIVITSKWGKDYLKIIKK